MVVAIAIAVGGALGALARFGVMELVERYTVTVFPWDTLAVNLTGCFLVAVAVTGLVDRLDTPAWLRIGLVVGFLGAYTTFSTFAQDLHDLAAGERYALAVADAAASVGLGFLAVVLGVIVARAL